MKWWVFNEEQLLNALNGFRVRVTQEQNLPREGISSDDMHAIVTSFLLSPEARAHNLRGDK